MPGGRFLVLCVLVCTRIASGAVCSSVQDGAWNSAATWDSGIPGDGDRAVIAHQVALSGGTFDKEIAVLLPDTIQVVAADVAANSTTVDVALSE
ncbi:MAG: hypothetical protein JW909_07285 [Planctomycetes bacterium]|nr:hypothetical protein [Planctomycetota bacterium]